MGPLAFDVLKQYMLFLGSDMKFKSNDPLFPRNVPSSGLESRTCISKELWKNTSSARKVITSAFVSNGMPAYCPHSFRNSLTHLGYKYCQTPEEFKAWSANLGHKSTLTTFTSYGHIDEDRQGDIIQGFSQRGLENIDQLTPDQARQIASIINQKGVQ